MPIERIQTSAAFDRSFKSLDENLKNQVRGAMRDLISNPPPKRLRVNRLRDTNPPIFAIHVTSNHSHKLTFNLDGTTAILRRVGTHKEIDRSP